MFVEQHAENVRRYRKELREKRDTENKEPLAASTDGDELAKYWQRLEELERQEEEGNELCVVTIRF